MGAIETPPAARPAHWPAAIEVVNESARSPVVLLCEHASNYIPPEYAGLGLSANDLVRHIAWDIGAAAVTRTLARLLDASAFLGSCSRLMIDLNRPPQAPASIVTRSETTDIPGNSTLTDAERARRISHIFDPYHQRVEAEIIRRERAGRHCVLVAVHSFTPVYLGHTRPWHAGVLFDKADEFGRSLIKDLSRDSTLHVEANVPYTVSMDEDYGLLVHGDLRGHPAVLLEIRNDLIADDAGAQHWARLLAAALADNETVCRDSTPRINT